MEERCASKGGRESVAIDSVLASSLTGEGGSHMRRKGRLVTIFWQYDGLHHGRVGVSLREVYPEGCMRTDHPVF